MTASCSWCIRTNPSPSPDTHTQQVTWALKQGYPGRILTAEITPEDPRLMAEYGFDAIWVHSGGWVEDGVGWG